MVGRERERGPFEMCFLWCQAKAGPMALVPDYQVVGEPKALLLREYNFRDTLGSEVGKSDST